MASSKDAFEPRAFLPRAFAAGAFRGVGVTAEVEYLGLEYTAPPGLLHWRAEKHRQHFTAPVGLLHWTAPEQDR